jgi:hypothetical protein
LLADLRSENAKPDPFDLGSRRPKVQELFKVMIPTGHLTSDRAMYVDPMTLDVLKDAFVSRGFPSFIVFRLKAVDGH